MEALRRLILSHRAVAALLLAAALALRLLVPAGYMPAVADGAMRLVLCPAAGPGRADPPPAPRMAGMHHDRGDHPADHGPQAPPCAYAGLSWAPVMPVDLPLLAAAIVFAMALVRVRAALAPPVRAPFLRPPLRGPPAIA